LKVPRNTKPSRGRLFAQIAGACEDYGIEEGSVSIIIRTFMALQTEQPVHWIDMGSGVLLFALSKPDDPASGVVYVYDKKGRAFWGIDFEHGSNANGDQFLSRQEFEALAEEYGLENYALQPARLAGLGKA